MEDEGGGGEDSEGVVVGAGAIFGNLIFVVFSDSNLESPVASPSNRPPLEYSADRVQFPFR